MKQTGLVLIAILLLAGFNLYSQAPVGQFGIFGALSLPSGDFADDDLQSDNGLAKTGFGGGASFTLPLGAPGLVWETDVFVVFNGIDESSIEEEDLTVDAGQWMNIPIMTGLRYASPIGPTMQIYGLGQIGLTFINGPDIEVSEVGTNDPEKLEIGSGTSFGFGVGAGLIFNDKFNISLRYLALGSTDLEVSIDGEEIPDADYEPSISMMVITAGINF